MKPIRFAKSFEKAYAKRVLKDKKLKKAFEDRYTQFARGARGAPLNDHGLVGGMAGKRSFSITGDVRVIYYDMDDCYRFIDVGTHAQVYGK